jgi:hypothetical protein
VLLKAEQLRTVNMVGKLSQMAGKTLIISNLGGLDEIGSVQLSTFCLACGTATPVIINGSSQEIEITKLKYPEMAQFFGYRLHI